MPVSFVHLRLHTEFSLVDGLVRVKPLVKVVAAAGMPAVAVTDITDNGLSAVYTYYDPDCQHRSLGTYAILQQVQWARRLQLPHLYLGYWIARHRKMDYKRHFNALEAYDGQQWQPLAANKRAED